MQDKTIDARIRATIEEELGTFRQLADLPATDIETIAERLTRALEPYLQVAERAERAA